MRLRQYIHLDVPTVPSGILLIHPAGCGHECNLSPLTKALHKLILFFEPCFEKVVQIMVIVRLVQSYRTPIGPLADFETVTKDHAHVRQKALAETPESYGEKPIGDYGGLDVGRSAHGYIPSVADIRLLLMPLI